ncbi:hypothetical protein HZP35_15275 [Elizabethkingia anophelis]|nr:hypothetical protein [Elizabethkingia anophelis]MCT4170623.1 hypothetical protein [Elizabethkingia anophelis]MCT4245039.1 hypothetical protein [Elizabethkingia anophelis]MCT4248840.1 hypothetical protein [Elizabethkingia anophelis]MCT4259763.1 hypothetical protein [Elizabethkingia anophelis]
METDREQKHKLTQRQQTLLTQPNQKINLGKVVIEYCASILVLLAALLPFSNNIVGYFIDTSITFSNKSGKGVLDLDDILFFSSWPVALSFLFIGLTFGAKLLPKIAVIISLFIQYVLLIQFIFFDKNNFDIGGLIGSIVTFSLFVFGAYKLYIYYTKVLIVDEFKDATLEKFSSILKRANDI